ncbi:uncharacterized protein LOC122377481 [Amphibalanus amphitrite]|uniref:uncharacterized protein LOC122377481 n=1 Tax=Amphibalanus amphitrite TaxID=1232801 RepID=UPI001C928F56|nr:uncharacterized protein LOC122377481 [Amphibalanus amphitrite]
MAGWWWRLLLGALAAAAARAPLPSCPPADVAFELWTGFVYSAPADLLDTRPGTLLLDQCAQLCAETAACRALNYETGLCVLFSSSAEQFPGSVTRSQYPVFTLYLQKMCLSGAADACRRPWAFERVPGHQLSGYSRRRVGASSGRHCLQLCLHERTFPCRSASFRAASGECSLSELDRFSAGPGDSLVADPSADYYESNCVSDPVRICEFQPIPDKILKTVDVVFQEVASRDDCQRLCLGANFRCHTFDYGDTGAGVCRLSHHGQASLAHVREPYLEIPGATSYERQSCYNVTLQCAGDHMTATVHTSRVFNGKIYARNSPNSCVLDVHHQMAVSFRLGYQDLSCDVRQDPSGVFTSDIVIQHHDQIVTSSDVGLSLRCLYQLGEHTVQHWAGLSVDGRLPSADQHTALVRSPNVTMSVTDRSGNDISTAQVGDPLALQFAIVDQNSPYEILVRSLLAQDGVDSAEIVLIDERGCPTDPSIMGAVAQVAGSGQLLTVPFDAFKFPSSDLVQFKALVTPCVPRCRPVSCDRRGASGPPRQAISHGRRRRAVGGRHDDVLVVQKIRIADTFEFPAESELAGAGGGARRPADSRLHVTGPALAAAAFLAAQLCVLLGWLYLRRRDAGRAKVQYYVNSSAAQRQPPTPRLR